MRISCQTCRVLVGYIKKLLGAGLTRTAKCLITWQLVPAPFTPAGQAPIVFLPQGFGRGQLLRLQFVSIRFHIVKYLGDVLEGFTAFIELFGDDSESENGKNCTN